MTISPWRQSGRREGGVRRFLQAVSSRPIAGQPDTSVDPSERRRRLGIALGAGLLLAVIVVVAALTASSGTPESEDPDDCVAAWNSSRTALADGQHALQAHDYSDVLVTRVDREGEVLEPEAEEGRCLVVFAAEEVDFEPDFGVRVYSPSGWAGLYFTDAVPLEEIERIQQDAVGAANARLEDDGTIILNG